METIKLILLTPWEEVKEKIKERNIGLTDEDLVYEPGQEEALLERLAMKMNRTKEEIRHFVESVAYNRDVAS